MLNSFSLLIFKLTLAISSCGHFESIVLAHGFLKCILFDSVRVRHVTHVDAHIGTSQAREISPDWVLCSFHESPSSLITALLTSSPCTVPTPDLELAVCLRSAVPVGGVWCLGP